MDQTKKCHDADLAAEMNHFQTEAIEQKHSTRERMPLVIDPATANLAAGMQAKRLAFAKYDKGSD